MKTLKTITAILALAGLLAGCAEERMPEIFPAENSPRDTIVTIPNPAPDYDTGTMGMTDEETPAPTGTAAEPDEETTTENPTPDATPAPADSPAETSPPAEDTPTEEPAEIPTENTEVTQPAIEIPPGQEPEETPAETSETPPTAEEIPEAETPAESAPAETTSTEEAPATETPLESTTNETPSAEDLLPAETPPEETADPATSDPPIQPEENNITTDAGAILINLPENVSVEDLGNSGSFIGKILETPEGNRYRLTIFRKLPEETFDAWVMRSKMILFRTETSTTTNNGRIAFMNSAPLEGTIPWFHIVVPTSSFVYLFEWDDPALPETEFAEDIMLWIKHHPGEFASRMPEHFPAFIRSIEIY